MSNRVCIEPTKFVDVRSGSESYGFRACDNYGQTYCNSFESIPDNDLEFLALVVENTDDILQDMLNMLIEDERGLDIGDKWYDYDDIKDVIKSKPLDNPKY